MSAKQLSELLQEIRSEIRSKNISLVRSYTKVERNKWFATPSNEEKQVTHYTVLQKEFIAREIGWYILVVRIRKITLR